MNSRVFLLLGVAGLELLACDRKPSGEPRAAPATSPPAAVTDEDRIRAFVFPVAARGPLPHRVHPVQAILVLRNELTPDIKPDDLESACNLVRFYRLHSVLSSLHVYLSTPAETADDALRRLSVVRLFADLGTPMLQEEAVRAFGDLAATEVVKDERVAREARRTLKYLPRPTVAMLRAIALRDSDRPEDDVRVLLEASEVRAATLAIEDDTQRSQAMADLFAGVVERQSDLFREWSGYALIWEAQRSGSATLVAALRNARDRIDAHWTEERGRVTRAIVFFGGIPNSDEQQLLKPGDEFQP